LTACDLRESIKKRFDAEGVEIPFPYRTIVYKNEMASNARMGDENQFKDPSSVIMQEH
jgi:small-conductance mechanosensitive channel